MSFFWLVGESELKVGDVQVAPGVTRQQRSVVAIKKCRYLEASGCVGLCVNMCKVGPVRPGACLPCCRACLPAAE
jgi:hypothetical protein